MEGDFERWNTEADRYHQLGDLLKVIAERSCGVAVDDTTHRRWREIMGLMTEVDSYVDERLVRGLGSREELVDELTRFDRFRKSYPSLAPEFMTGRAWSETSQTAFRVIDAFGELRQAATFDEYVQWRREEAEVTADLFAACATDEVRDQAEFHGQFMPILRRVGAGACFLDSAKDLADDYRAGISILEPRPTYRARLLLASVREVLPEARLVLSPQIRRELGRAAVLHAGRHLRKSLQLKVLPSDTH